MAFQFLYVYPNIYLYTIEYCINRLVVICLCFKDALISLMSILGSCCLLARIQSLYLLMDQYTTTA